MIAPQLDPLRGKIPTICSHNNLETSQQTAPGAPGSPPQAPLPSRPCLHDHPEPTARDTATERTSKARRVHITVPARRAAVDIILFFTFQSSRSTGMLNVRLPPYLSIAVHHHFPHSRFTLLKVVLKGEEAQKLRGSEMDTYQVLWQGVRSHLLVKPLR